YTHHDTIFVPGSLPLGVGKEYLLFEANMGSEVGAPDETINESDTSNNVVAVPIMLKVPDLAVTDATFDGTVVPGASVSLTYTVTNQGTVTAFGPWKDLVGLNHGPTALYSFGALATSPFSGQLDPGGSETRTVEFQVPSFIDPYDTHALVWADGNRELNE